MSKFFAHGTALSIGGSAIGSLVSIDMPERTKGDIEITDAESAGDREYIPGLREGDSITFECRREDQDVGQIALRTNYEADGTTAAIVLTLPASATSGATTITYSFTGYVNSLGGSLPQVDDDAASLTASIKVTGAVTFADA